MIKILNEPVNRRFFKNGKPNGKYRITHPDFSFGNYYAYPDDFIGDGQKFYYLEFNSNYNDPFRKMMEVLKETKIPLRVGSIYWNLINNNDSYIGSGIYNLYYAKNTLETNQFAILYDFVQGFIVIYNDIKLDKLIIKIMASNEEYPYVDIVDSIRKICINNGFMLNSSKFLYEREVRKIQSFNEIKIELYGYLIEKSKLYLSNKKVIEVVMKHPIIKNTFIKCPENFDGLDYILNGILDLNIILSRNKDIKFRINMNSWELGVVNIISNKLIEYYY